jgi:hypothetical protein
MVQQQSAAITRQSQEEQAARRQQTLASRDANTKASPVPEGRRTPGLVEAINTLV